MGHDIYAFDKTTAKQLAYCRIDAFNSLMAYLLYESLGAQQFNGGVSGTGEEGTFTKEEIKQAVEKFNLLKEKSVSDLINAATDKRAESLAIILTGQGCKVNTPNYNDEELEMIKKEVLDFLNCCKDQDVIILFS